MRREGRTAGIAAAFVLQAALIAAGARFDAVARPAVGASIPRPVVHGPGAKRLPASAYPGRLPSFEERYVGKEQAWEPTIGFGPDGTAYYMVTNEPAKARTGIDVIDDVGGLHPEVWRSDDQGRTWADVSPRYVPATNMSQDVDRVGERPTISGDPYLWTDPRTGWVFAYQQQAYLLCDDLAISSDGGSSWDASTTCPQYVAADDSYGDHPTIVSGRPRARDTNGYPNVVYFCSSSGCRSSLDGGSTWGPWVNPDPACRETLEFGHVKTAPDGTVYVPRKACGGARISISRDDGRTWRSVYVDKTVWQESIEDGVPELDHDGAVAIDAKGNAYYFWLGGDRLPYLSVSRDVGRTWTKPMMVGAPGVTYALFPEITAGRKGRIAFTYFGTTVKSGNREDPNATWHQYVGFSLNALHRRPVFATVTAHTSADSIRRGPCFNFRCYIDPGVLGNGVPNEGVGDFLDIRVNPRTGAVWVAMVDLCNDACAGREGSAADPATARAAVGVQVSGTKL
ncbi:MAG: sialidase family protein [Actinomycetota bacterium]